MHACYWSKNIRKRISLW